MKSVHYLRQQRVVEGVSQYQLRTITCLSGAYTVAGNERRNLAVCDRDPRNG